MLSLVRRSLARAAAPVAALGGVLVVFQVVIVVVAASFERSGSFERMMSVMPVFVTRSFTSSLLTLASFRAMSVAGYFHPVVVLILTELAIYLASEPAGDVEIGIVDLVLARPLPRRLLVARSLAAAGAATVVVVAAMGMATALGLTVFAPPLAPWPSAGTVAVLSVELLLVAWACGAGALAVSAFVRRRATAVATAGVMAVAAYLLEFLGASWAPAARLSRISPFHYYDGTAILVGRAHLAADAAVLGAMIAAGVAIAFWQFARRDL